MGYEFFGEKIIFPSTLVPGINNDQSLKRMIDQVKNVSVQSIKVSD